MKIVNPLSVNQTKEHISSVLFALAGQNDCDGSPYDQMQIAGEYIIELEKQLAETHDWLCGCGHWNGPNLSVCALCGRTPGGI